MGAMNGGNAFLIEQWANFMICGEYVYALGSFRWQSEGSLRGAFMFAALEIHR